mgnify:CR=1 FL=1
MLVLARTVPPSVSCLLENDGTALSKRAVVAVADTHENSGHWAIDCTVSRDSPSVDLAVENVQTGAETLARCWGETEEVCRPVVAEKVQILARHFGKAWFGVVNAAHT